ncbi:MAG: Holliday junction branch migration protein RuvA [Chloroflexi bacterium]|nr:Holliday junction branch migration protein RuvA [Chloroflexota bacterium]
MIVGLHGTLEKQVAEGIVVRTGGFGILVHVPSSTAARLGRPGDEVDLHTYLHVREDALSLYGFSSEDELGLFKSLMGVSGVGPKLALSLLSTLNPDQLTLAILSGDKDMLTQVPGIGKKTAERLIFELKGKLEKAGAVALSLPGGDTNAEAVAALTSLGYTVSEASRALASLPPSKTLTLEEKVKMALQALGSR